jgi:hypothetical protein
VRWSGVKGRVLPLVTILFGIFLIMHGLVHLLYAGQSMRKFELRPGMSWPDSSWLITRLPGEVPGRLLVCISLALVTFGFVAGGLGLFLGQAWWRPLTVGAAILSTAIYSVCWDGNLKSLSDNGGIGVLINFSILFLASLSNGLPGG